MSAFSERRVQDVRKLRELAERSAGKLIVGRVSGDPIHQIALELRYITAPSNRYPDIKSDRTELLINLSARYPLQAPTAEIKTPIFHPNVFSSGQICLGAKWQPTETLDLLNRAGNLGGIRV